MTVKAAIYTLGHAEVRMALGFAGLDGSALKAGPHPDSGEDCLRLAADVRQYSAFLVALAVQRRAADELSFLSDQVQIEHDSNGDTRFWLLGLNVQS